MPNNSFVAKNRSRHDNFSKGLYPKRPPCYLRCDGAVELREAAEVLKNRVGRKSIELDDLLPNEYGRLRFRYAVQLFRGIHMMSFGQALIVRSSRLGCPPSVLIV